MLPTTFNLTLTDGTTEIKVANHAPFTSVGYGMDWNTGINGWWDSPSQKVEMTERQAGMGAHNITDDMVLYSARTITVAIYACATDRASMQEQQNKVNRLLGKLITITVEDDEQETYATGFLTVDWDDVRHGGVYEYQQGTLTIVCADPRRYSTEAHRYFLGPLTGLDGGLLFDDNGCMLLDPVQFYGTTEAGNVCVLENNGTATAYPTITVTGYWPSGVTLNLGSGGQLAYSGAIYYQNLVIDCLTRTAAINGVDVTRNFTSRDFPSIKVGESVRVSCMSAGTGGVEVSVHDTYI